MRRSFGNRDMGRAVGRAVRGVGGGVIRQSTNTTGTKPNSISSSLTAGSLSTSVSSSHHLSLANNPWATTWHSSSSCFPDTDIWEWEHVEHEDDGYVFGTPPSREEVDGALSSLQQFLAPASYSQFIEDNFPSSTDKDITTEMDWVEPSMQFYNSRTMYSCGGERVYDAFHLLQADPSIQRVVISLSTDKAVWDAVMNNEVVRELQDNYAAESDGSSTESPGAAKSVLSWILDTSKAKLMELMDKITKLLTEVFTPSHEEEDETTAGKAFGETLRSSVLLSIVVLLIVLVTRAPKA